MYKIINCNTGEVSDNSIPNNYKWFEFDSAEEALFELLIGKMWLTLSDKTLFGIKNIVHPLIVRGVVIPNHFYWRKYIFFEQGRIVGYVGEMNPKVEKLPVAKPDLSKVNWDLYSEEEREKHFRTIYKSLGLKPDDDNDKIEYNPVPYEEDRKDKRMVVINEKSYSVPYIDDYTKVKHDIYLLYCDKTPNIYYVGHSTDVKSRFRTHLNNNRNHTTFLKHEWIMYVKDKGYELKYDILETKVTTYGGYFDINKLEDEWIEKYISNKENVVLNFTTKHYKTHNSLFIEKFKACLYRKKTIIVEDYNMKLITN